MNHSPANPEPAPPRRPSKWRRLAAVAAVSLLSLSVLLLLGVAFLILWLSPSNLSNLVNTKASEFLNADVRTHNIRFSVWSSFPNLKFEVDSLSVVSRSLDSLSDRERSLLPGDADLLLSSGRLSGAINVTDLLDGRISLRDLAVDSLRLNLVALNDSVANYDILPLDFVPDIPLQDISINKIQLTRPAPLTYFDAPSRTAAAVGLRDLRLSISRKNTLILDLRTRGSLDLCTEGRKLIQDLPFGLDGDIRIALSHLSVTLDRFKIAFGNIDSRLSMRLTLPDDTPLINALRLDIPPFSPLLLMKYFPTFSLPVPDNIRADLIVGASVSMPAPYRLGSSHLPSLRIALTVPPCDVVLRKPDLTLRQEGLSALIRFNGPHPEASSVEFAPFRVLGKGFAIKLAARFDRLDTPSASVSLHAAADLSRAAAILTSLRPYGLHGNLDLTAQAKLSLPPLFSVKDLDRVSAKREDSDSVGAKREFFLSGSATCTGLRFRHPGTETLLSARSISFGVKLGDRASRSLPKPMPEPADSAFLATIPHSPEWLDIAPVPALKAFLDSYDFSAKILADGAEIITKAYPARNRIGRLRMVLTPDLLRIDTLTASSRSTCVSVKGKVSGLRSLFSGCRRPPLDVCLSLAFDTLNLNELAGTYVWGEAARAGVKPDFHVRHDTLITSSDSVCGLVPRNIRTRIDLTTRETLYADLPLSGLRATITATDGNAAIRGLDASTTFGRACVDIAYASSDARNLSLSAKVGLFDIDIRKFFHKYNSFLLKAPEMKNLSGSISGEADASIGIFSDMWADLPSLRARVNIISDGLRLRQNGFIHRIARMMLIRSRDDIQVRNLDINATVHDNLVEIFPFDFDFSRYRLRFSGLNNFSGDMYYHIGVRRSPLPFRFGVGLSGTFSRPSLSLGGSSPDPQKAEKVTARIETSGSANIIHEASFILRLLLMTAAKSDSTNLVIPTQ